MKLIITKNIFDLYFVKKVQNEEKFDKMRKKSSKCVKI